MISRSGRAVRRLTVAAVFGAAACLGVPILSFAADDVVAPSAARQCLTPPEVQRGQPDYPIELWKLGETARVRVELHFATSDAAPAVTLLSNSGRPEFFESVRRHVSSWRVPCLGGASGEREARLVQEYVFQPAQRLVFSTEPMEADMAKRRSELRCMAHESGEKAPSYPPRAAEIGLMGRVVADLVFTAPDQPPRVELLARRNAEVFKRVVEGWTAGLRLPCLSDRPMPVRQFYSFIMQGEPYGFRPMSLTDLLGLVKGIQDRPLDLDTTAMGCPFDLLWTYLRPLAANRVAEVGNQDAARQPLIDFLRDVEIDAGPRTQDQLFADTAHVAVPCVKIKLTPKEKS